MPKQKKRGRPAKLKVVTVEVPIEIIEEARKKSDGFKDNWTLSLQLGNELYESFGETMFEALTNLSRPQKMLTKSVLTVTHGDNSKTLSLSSLQLKRLFFPIGRVWNAKMLGTGL